MAEEENREEERDGPHFSLFSVSGKVIGFNNGDPHLAYVNTMIELKKVSLDPDFSIGLCRFEPRSGLKETCRSEFT